MKMTAWTTLSLALLIALALIVAGKWSQHAVLALGALVLIGALVPPIGFLFGAVALLTIVFTNDLFSGTLEGAWTSIRDALTGKKGTTKTP